MDFNNLRDNPNDPVSVQPALLFTEVTPIPSPAFSGLYRDSQYHNFLPADLGVGGAVDYRYGSAGFSYDALRDVNKMAEEAKSRGVQQYVILAKFLRAYYYINMTREMGDIPLSEAMKGAEKPKPKYDTQKSVYIQCLDWLDEANRELGEFIQANPGATVSGDIYFSGNLKKWQKAINAYTIRILTTLSKHADDPDLNVTGLFTNIVENPNLYPLMTSIADNMQITHKDEDTFRDTYNPNNQILAEGVVYADTYIDMLKEFEDPRLPIVADPTPKALEENSNSEDSVRADENSYNGSDISVSQERNISLKAEGNFSKPNAERFLNFSGQPSILIGYPEQELHIAEAVHRGWISADPKTHYENGVRGSMEFYGVASADISDYLLSMAPYMGGDEGLERIHKQMYLNFAENSGWESWYMTRRTGVPQYKFSSVNNVEQLPIRWAYPPSEDTENRESYREALQRQFGSLVDDRNQVMWLIKKELD